MRPCRLFINSRANMVEQVHHHIPRRSVCRTGDADVTAAASAAFDYIALLGRKA